MKFRHEALTCVLRVHPERGVETLLRRRHREPFAGSWSLPSGSLDPEESIQQSALRHLERRTGLVVADAVAHVEQLETYSAPSRDPWDRTIATGYLCLVPWDRGELTGEQDESSSRDAAWLPVADREPLAFDHDQILASALERLRSKISYSNIAYALVPETFTITQLRGVYEAVLGYEVAPTNLARVLTRRGQLADTGEKLRTRTGGRPAALYRFTTRQLQITDPFAVFKPSSAAASASASTSLTANSSPSHHR